MNEEIVEYVTRLEKAVEHWWRERVDDPQTGLITPFEQVEATIPELIRTLVVPFMIEHRRAEIGICALEGIVARQQGVIEEQLRVIQRLGKADPEQLELPLS